MDPTQRFGDRVGVYARYRPGYPPELLECLELRPDSVIADIGSGTGLLSRVFLDRGHTVYGVEPNQPMREAGQAALAHYPAFHSRDGRAEATGLSERSVDLVVAGQAFHWFDPERARREFQRILRPAGLVALVWNDRNQSSPFEQDYLKLMDEFAVDYRALRVDRSGDASVLAFFPSPPRRQDLASAQEFDLEGLRGRVMSSSCMPARDTALQARIDGLFTRHQRDGRVRLTYTTRLYWGQL